MTAIVTSIVIVLLAALAYNRLVTLRNRVRAAWSQIDVQLRRRHDLIPNLLASVRDFMAHERKLLARVSETREQAVAAGGEIALRAGFESNLDTSLLSLVSVAQAMPE